MWIRLTSSYLYLGRIGLHNYLHITTLYGFIDVSVPIQENERSFKCVFGVSMFLLFLQFWLYFGTVVFFVFHFSPLKCAFHSIFYIIKQIHQIYYILTIVLTIYMYIYITWNGSSTDFIKWKPCRIILHQFGSKVQCTSSCYFYIPFTDVVLTDCPNPGFRILMIESKVTILIGLWCLTPLSIFYIVVVKFIGGGNRSTRRKRPTCRKSLTNFTTWCSIEYTLPWTGFKRTGSCQSHYHMIMNTTAHNHFEWMIRFILHWNITKTKSLTNRRFSHSRYGCKKISFLSESFRLRPEKWDLF